MSQYGSDLTVDEAILIAEFHPEVDSVLDAFAQSSRASTRDDPAGWSA